MHRATPGARAPALQVGGIAGTAGSAGSAGSGGSAGGGAETYTAARACELFAAATCAKGAECGLVLAATATQVVCLDCNPETLGLIADACEQALMGAKDADDVDGCLANVAAGSCDDACADADVPACEVFAELPDADDDEPVVCDAVCTSN
jgi:hypothetical protein